MAAISSLVELATQWIDISLLALLACTAIAVVRMRSLWAAVMMTGIYSFLGASWMLILDAPDVAFTEAAVGAGISTVLMLSTLALTGTSMKERKKSPLLPLAVVTVTGAALVYGTVDMPHFGDPDAPIHNYPEPSYVTKATEEIHVPNIVTAVLASYRGYDTLGETVVIFTAGIAVVLILRGEKRGDERKRDVSSSPETPTNRLYAMRHRSILRIVSKVLIPYILLFALYVQFHGDYGPGGGFQAGVIFAAAVILYGLVFELPSARRVAPPKLVEVLIALGVLIFAGTGVAAMLLGGNFLDYNTFDHHLWPGFLPHGQHLGILIVELGVGITVAAVMITVFFAFAGRERSR